MYSQQSWYQENIPIISMRGWTNQEQGLGDIGQEWVAKQANSSSIHHQESYSNKRMSPSQRRKYVIVREHTPTGISLLGQLSSEYIASELVAAQNAQDTHQSEFGKEFGKEVGINDRLPEFTPRPGARRAYQKIVQSDELRAHQQQTSYESLSISQELQKLNRKIQSNELKAYRMLYELGKLTNAI